MKITGTKIERAFALKMQSEGWEVYKNGFPDFLCTKDGKGILVEVKANDNQKLKTHQLMMMSLLTNRKLKTCVWSPDIGFHSNKTKRKIKTPAKRAVKEYVPYPNFLSIPEAAKLLGITRQAVHLRIKAGTLKCTIIAGNKLINKKDI